MKITCWGSRGSIPVSGKPYCRYGGDTTCIEVRSKNNEIIIIDAGTGIRRLGNQLFKEKPKQIHLLFTHTHWDHLIGLPLFKPLFDKHIKILIKGHSFTSLPFQRILERTMESPYFPVPFSEVESKMSFSEIHLDQTFKIDTIKIIPIILSHPNKGIGYKLIEDNQTFVFLTDNNLGYQMEGGKTFEEYQQFVKDADILFHDAEYLPDEYKEKQTWGHSSYEQAVNLALKANVKTLGLFHHNQERTDREIDQILKKCKQIIKKSKSNLTCQVIAPDMTFKLPNEM